MAVGTYGTDCSHAVMNTSWAKSTLDDLETTTRAENHVGSWNANVLECEMTVTVRSIVVSVDRQHSVDGDAWGVGRH